MAYTKRTWLGRQGTGLNKFSIGGATPVTIVNQPDSVTQVGDALSAGNLNDLEDRIEDAFDDVDTELDTKADEQDVTNLNDALSATNKRVENLEEAHGSYHEVDVKSVYTIPSGKGSNWIVDGLRGVSRVNNQLVADNKIHQTITGQNGTYVRNEFGNFNLIQGHKYLVAMIGSAPRVNGLIMTNDYSQRSEPISALSSVIIELTSASGLYSIWTIETQDVSYDFDLILRDLTVYFNGTIPTDADTIAEIQQNYPELLIPSDYDAGSIVSTTYSAVKSVGVNIWDEEWELGRWSVIDGTPAVDSTRIRCKNLIPVLPSTAYYLKFPTGTNIDFNYCFFDIGGNFISGGYSATNISVTTPANAYYMKFYMGAGYGTTYNHDIQICLNSYADKTTYHPYKTDTLTLPEEVTLRRAGSVYDEHDLDSGVTDRRIGSVDLGTLNWTKQNSIFYSDAYSDVVAVGSYDVVNGVCAGYIPVTLMTVEATSNSIAVSNTPRIYVNDTSLASVTAEQFKTAMSGKIFYYEKATPDADTPLTVLTDNWIATEGGGTLEAVKTYDIDDSFTVGYLTL